MRLGRWPEGAEGVGNGGWKMKIAYLVLAHMNPGVVERAIGALDSEDCAFFVHIDQKSDITKFSRIAGKNIFFTEKRVPVYWGQFSQVEAILMLLQKAMKGPDRYDYFVLVSGSDYPLRSASYISAFFREHYGTEFISLVRVPSEAAGKPLSRMNTFVLPSSQPVRRFLVRAMAKLGLAERDYRKYLGGLEAYSGSTWWALTREACQYILDFTEDNPKVAAYFRNTFASDEAYIHTILGNSKFQSRIRRNLMYDDWTARGASPETISDQHIARFGSQPEVTLDDVYGIGEALFARKFSDDQLALLQTVDEMILRKEQVTLQAKGPGR
jgi:hypothetical protein